MLLSPKKRIFYCFPYEKCFFYFLISNDLIINNELINIIIINKLIYMLIFNLNYFHLKNGLKIIIEKEIQNKIYII